MQTNIYTLPEITFVGGETQEFTFHLKNQQGFIFDASGSTSDFAICNYSNKNGTPLLHYTPTLAKDGNNISSILKLTIPKEDTALLSGKYIYQITIIDVKGNAEIPGQGIFNIIKNIHQEYIV